MSAHLSKTTRRAAAVLLLPLLLLCHAAAARVVVLPSGRLAVVSGGRVVLRGVNPSWVPAPVTSWINATMTSNTTPSPNEVSTFWTITDPWKAFDHDTATYLSHEELSTSGGMTYDFGTGNTALISKIVVKNVLDHGMKDWTLYGLDESLTPSEIATGTATNTETEQEFSVVTAEHFRGFQLAWSSIWDESTLITRIYEIKIYGSVP